MSKDSAKKPSVATYADHEVINPPNPLRKALSTVKSMDPNDDPVARAEQALVQLSGEFSAWMEAECKRLDQARCAVKSKGFSKATREALFHAAHDIKGQAATFGYPWVAGSADSLCRLIEHTPDMNRIPVARPEVLGIADELTKRLREVTEEFLTQENRDRPDYLEGILAPPLAPSDKSF